MENNKTLRELRKEKGLTRKYVASKLNITPDQLSRIERGENSLQPKYIKTLSQIYEKPEQFFLTYCVAKCDKFMKG